MYIDEAIKDDQAVTEDLEDDIADLQLVLGLGAKEATDIVTAVTATAYRCCHVCTPLAWPEHIDQQACRLTDDECSGTASHGMHMLGLRQGHSCL